MRTVGRKSSRARAASSPAAPATTRRARTVRPHATQTGRVRRGEGRGRTLGFPTANLPPPDAPARDGVYAALVRIEGERRLRPALANLGPSPTFAVDERRLEVHLLDYDGDLYGTRLHVELRVRLDGQRRCASPDALARRIRKLAAAARSIRDTGSGEGA